MEKNKGGEELKEKISGNIFGTANNYRKDSSWYTL